MKDKTHLYMKILVAVCLSVLLIFVAFSGYTLFKVNAIDRDLAMLEEVEIAWKTRTITQKHIEIIKGYERRKGISSGLSDLLITYYLPPLTEKVR